MDSQAVEQAQSRLRRAKKALEALKTATNYEEAEEAWSDLLLASATIYSKLEQGSKSKGTSAGWFGRKKKGSSRNRVGELGHEGARKLCIS
jgi:hypothetical protein